MGINLLKKRAGCPQYKNFLQIQGTSAATSSLDLRVKRCIKLCNKINQVTDLTYQVNHYSDKVITETL
jgi:hypothetical protein